ncbi:hypothetical protein DQW50_17465 [Halorubrum sp. 48-1-W]|nr:hypothetical protein DQW50_17465 [Halorubrum sp. 48-1-W]
MLTLRQHTIAWSNVESSITGDPDDTERPRLTSDLRLRRSAGGEILIFRGPKRCPVWVINPSEFVGPANPGRVERPEFAVRSSRFVRTGVDI